MSDIQICETHQSVLTLEQIDAMIAAKRAEMKKAFSVVETHDEFGGTTGAGLPGYLR